MALTTDENRIRQQVEQKLLASGWKQEDILYDQTIPSRQNLLRPDGVLLYNLYPFAILEVKRPASLPDMTFEQVDDYAQALDVPFAFATDGETTKEINIVNGTIRELAHFPTPAELWLSLDREWNDNDPRLYPPFRDEKMAVRLHQALAVSRILEAIANGHRRILASMATGSGRMYVMFQIAWKLIQSGYCRRMLLLADYRAVIQHAMSVFSPFSWDLFVLDQSSTTGENSRVHFGVTAHFLHPEVSPRFQVLPSDFYDLILLYNPYRTELQPSILEHFSQAIQVGFVEQLPGLKAVQHFGQPVYEYSMEDILKAEEISPPDGYTVVKLDEIADVRTGVTVKKSDEVEEAPYSEIYLITSRDLLPDGNVTLESTHKVKICALSKYFDSTGTLNEELLLRPGDILIASSGFVPKVAIISADLRDLATFASSLIRIRVDPNLADPQDVSTFLRSSTGRLSLFRFSSVSSTARRLSVRDIRQLLIFLPHKPSTLQKSDQLSSVSRAKRYITEEILPLLDERPSGELVGDLELVARKLNQFASTLVPPTLSEKVMNSYPTPIALTYRRFVGARFNVYEQVLRLKDLFEATSFFVYNLVLADALRRLDPQRYYIEERGARRAYNYYSMGQRMNYVAAILEVAKLNQGRDLFVPELVGSSFVDLANQLQDDLRNRLAHTATATESQQRRVLNEFQPIVEEMLDELQFLPDYRLVRVPSFYFEGGKIKRRMEVYQGAEPYLEEQEQAPGTDSVLIQADRDHLVFLDSEDQVLDLHPLYQLLASEETRYETHLCFFKQRRQQERRLEGESVQGAFPVELEGFGDFEALQTRIIDKRSGQ